MSVGLFAGNLELLWFWGVTDPKLLRRLHLSRHFPSGQVLQYGATLADRVGLNTGPSAGMAS